MATDIRPRTNVPQSHQFQRLVCLRPASLGTCNKMFSPSKKFPKSPHTAVPLYGLFKDGIWCCNCPARPPAARRQTKNGGKNHGRWCKFAKQGSVFAILSLHSRLIIILLSLHLRAAAPEKVRLLPMGRRS